MSKVTTILMFMGILMVGCEVLQTGNINGKPATQPGETPQLPAIMETTAKTLQALPVWQPILGMVGGVLVGLAGLWKAYINKQAAVSIVQSIENAKYISPEFNNAFDAVKKDMIDPYQSNTAKKIVDQVQGGD